MALRALIIIALTAFLWGGMARADEKTANALRTTETLLVKAHDALGAANGAAALRLAITDAFAFDIWERFLIEGRADAFSAAQRTEFRGLLPGFLAHLYRDQFDRGLSAMPEIGDARIVRRDVLVASRFKRTNGNDLPVEWRLREFPDSGTKVIDVMVAGTSFLLLKRDEFNAIIDSGGPEALLAHMRKNAL